MKPELHRRVKELVFEAERLEPSAREAFVEAACGDDPELRREVQRLLEVASRTPQDFLEPPSRDQDPLTATASVRVGQSLGRFRVTGWLGAGGMGQVLRAEDTDLRREVALKVLPTEFGRNSERLARFRREAQALAALKHPNIVTVYSIEEAAGLHFLCMELVEGKTLGELIPAEGLPLPRFFELVGPLVDAVAAAHDRGVVHRDIKPSNVMLSTDGELKVLDFGLAKLYATGAEESEGTEITRWRTEGMRVLGTPAYAAPEQLEGRGADHRSDIFSLGVVLYRMLSGRAP